MEAICIRLSDKFTHARRGGILSTKYLETKGMNVSLALALDPVSSPKPHCCIKKGGGGIRTSSRGAMLRCALKPL